MRVVLTHPFCWPYVRRGTERNMHELGRYLRSRGHEVITVTTAPGRRGTEATDAGVRLLGRSVWHPWLGRVRIQATHTFFFNAAWHLPALRADVVHSFCFADALAACAVRHWPRHKTIFQMNGVGVPGVSCRRWLPPEAWMFGSAIRGANGRIVCSAFVRELVRRYYRCDADVIPPPVSLDRWPFGAGPADGRPTFIAVADFTERRKGVRVLVDAFRRLATTMPDARLRLVGRMTPELERELRKDLPGPVNAAIETAGIGQVEDLPRAYQEADVTVLPSMWEPSGNVLLESWASGTPVVATDHAGIPEFFTRGVGVLFPPGSDGPETRNTNGLVDAMLQGFDLSRTPGTRARCRTHAEQYSIDVLGPRIERLYASL